MKRGSYRSGFFFGALSAGAAVAIGFISSIVTSRLFGVDIIGEYALAGAPIAAMWILSTIKEQQALIKEITQLQPRQPRVTQLFAAVFTFSTALTTVVGLIVAAISVWAFRGPLAAPDLVGPMLVSMAGYVVVTNTGWNIDSIFAAFVAGRQLFWVRLHEAISFVVLATAAGILWKSVWGMVVAMIGSSATALVHRALAARPFLRLRLSWAEYRKGLEVLPELLRFGLKATPGQIAQGVSGQGGVWALGVVAPISVVGAYSRALVIPKSVQQASMRITEVLYPTLVGRHTKGDRHGFDRALVDSIRYEVIAMLLFASAIGGAAHTVMALFGSGFDAAANALVLLALSPALASITITQTQALWATDKPGYSSVIAVVRLFVTIVLLVVLTPPMGVEGPAIALLAGYLVIVLLAGRELGASLARPARMTWPWRERLVLVPAYGAGFGVAHLIEAWTSRSLAALPLSLVAGSASYAAVLLLLRGLNERDIDRFGEIKSQVRGRLGRMRSGEPLPGEALGNAENA
jgi:O-antigen/teichoic acid export membrane protein